LLLFYPKREGEGGREKRERERERERKRKRIEREMEKKRAIVNFINVFSRAFFRTNVVSAAFSSYILALSKNLVRKMRT
jgi:hypothetical protein